MEKFKSDLREQHLDTFPPIGSHVFEKRNCEKLEKVCVFFLIKKRSKHMVQGKQQLNLKEIHPIDPEIIATRMDNRQTDNR